MTKTLVNYQSLVGSVKNFHHQNFCYYTSPVIYCCFDDSRSWSNQFVLESCGNLTRMVFFVPQANRNRQQNVKKCPTVGGQPEWSAISSSFFAIPLFAQQQFCGYIHLSLWQISFPCLQTFAFRRLICQLGKHYHLFASLANTVWGVESLQADI